MNLYNRYNEYIYSEYFDYIRPHVYIDERDIFVDFTSNYIWGYFTTSDLYYHENLYQALMKEVYSELDKNNLVSLMFGSNQDDSELESKNDSKKEKYERYEEIRNRNGEYQKYKKEQYKNKLKKKLDVSKLNNSNYLISETNNLSLEEEKERRKAKTLRNKKKKFKKIQKEKEKEIKRKEIEKNNRLKEIDKIIEDKYSDSNCTICNDEFNNEDRKRVLLYCCYNIYCYDCIYKFGKLKDELLCFNRCKYIGMVILNEDYKPMLRLYLNNKLNIKYNTEIEFSNGD